MLIRGVQRSIGHQQWVPELGEGFREEVSFVLSLKGSVESRRREQEERENSRAIS